MTALSSEGACRFCGGAEHRRLATFTAPPAGETDFGIADYWRELWQCAACGHVVNRYGFALENIYDVGYVDATYGQKMEATFRRIMALPPEASDNRQRVRRINDFVAAEARELGPTLDIGSGLGVFPAVLKETGWCCTALDPDPRATRHIEAACGVAAITGDFLTLEPDSKHARHFALVTLNKVIEHVAEPVAMLRRVGLWARPDGLVYIELPDGENALAEGGAEREEFFVEHYDAYSPASFALLLHQAGMRCMKLERLIEPSGKYTLAGFATLP